MSARILRVVLIFLAGVFLKIDAYATHVVGADFTYKLKDSIGYVYEITLVLYQDCLTGDPKAIAEDNPAKIRVYRGTSLTSYTMDPGGATTVQWCSNCPILVPANFNNECLNNPPATCLKRSVFVKDLVLPPSQFGYLISYQRCCRNGSITNILNPEGIGATYFCTIPPVPNAKNNSAEFKNFPPQIICANNPLFYDNSATDKDGDSLSYEFCQAFEGGGPSSPVPDPLPPPYKQVDYAPGYSPARPIAGNPGIQINPRTGLISGTPNLLGRFVVTVCCTEWRNGDPINVVKREFQFVVTNCSKAVVANIPQYSEEFNTYVVQCAGYTVKFDNLSTGGFAYAWDFGVPGTNTDVSSDFSPTFTYPDTGTYMVSLAVNRGSTCPDSISRFVKVYPTFKGGFSNTGLPCPNTPIQFTDESSSTRGPVSFWQWQFGDGRMSSDPNPNISYPQGGNYVVTLVSGNDKGCRDTVRRTLDIEKFRPFAGNDTIIVKGESIRFNATGGSLYSWTPGTNLNATTIPNPIGYYPVSDSFRYNVHIISEVGCQGDDDIKVLVVDQSALFVPSAFTPNADGLNDFLAPIAIGYRQFNFFRVFNRWGEMVFSTSNIGSGWDGSWKGKPADMGTYFWVLSSVNRFGAEEMQKGDVTLIR
jgi:gliding motility-associated-like protein